MGVEICKNRVRNTKDQNKLRDKIKKQEKEDKKQKRVREKKRFQEAQRKKVQSDGESSIFQYEFLEH